MIVSATPGLKQLFLAICLMALSAGCAVRNADLLTNNRAPLHDSDPPAMTHDVEFQQGGLNIIQECQERGGEYVIQDETLRVFCWLPARIRRLGPTPTYSVPRRILTSVYDYLRPGTEDPRYGLYSYVLLPIPSSRAETFFSELFKSTGHVIDSMIDLTHLNVIHLPTRDDRFEELAASLIEVGEHSERVRLFARHYYDYAFSRKLLAHVCISSAKEVQEVCEGDLSRGPYMFAYGEALSTSEWVPPPYLFLDLSSVHERAFGEFIAAFKQQVKRPDYTDRQKIHSLRLALLSIVLTAADWTAPVKRALEEIIYIGRAAS